MNQGGDGDEVRIPLTIDPDASGLASAQQAAQAFEGTVDQLQARLRELEAQAVRTFNALFPGQQAAGSYREVLDVARRSGAQNFAASMPAPAAAVRQAEALREQLPEARARDRAEARRERERAREERRRPAPFSERLTENVLRARPLAAMGAFATGDFRSGGMTLARAFIETLAGTPSRRATATIARAVVGTGGGGLGGLGGAAAGAGDAAAEGEAAAGAVGVGALGAIAAGIAVSGAVALGLNAVRSQVAGQEVALRANLGGTAGADMSGVLGGVLTQGQRFAFKPQEAIALASQLGAAGVGAGDVGGALGNTMAMSRLTGMDPAQLTQLTAQLMVQGHQSAEEVGRVFQMLREGADRSGISVTRLVSSLQDFQRVTGNAGLGVQGAAGLAAVQGMLGPAVSAGSLLGPAMGAVGEQALRTAGFLGISPDRLERIQTTRDVPAMFDLMAASAKRIGTGLTGQTRVDAVEAAFQNAGVLSTAGIAPENATGIIQKLLTQGPRAAEDARDATLRANAAAHARTLQQQGEQMTNLTISAMQRLGLAADFAKEALGLFGNDINKLTGALTGTPAGYGLQVPGARPDTLNPPAGGMVITNPLTGEVDRLGNNLLGTYQQAAQRYAVPLGVLLEQGSAESNFRSSVVNRQSGARGIAQFTPSTLNTLRQRQGSPIYGMTQQQAMAAAMNPQQAIPLQAYYLSLLNQQDQGWQAALGDYNGGPRWQHSAAARNYASRILSAGASLETRFSNAPPVAPARTESHHTVNVTVHLADPAGKTLGTVTVQHTAPRLPVGHRTHGPTPAPIPSATPPPRHAPR